MTLAVMSETAVSTSAGRRSTRRPPRIVLPWWSASVVAGVAATAVLGLCAFRGAGTGWFDRGSVGWWMVTSVLHAPYVVILLFLLGGLVERLGYSGEGGRPDPAGRLPTDCTPPCACSCRCSTSTRWRRRVIEAASAMTWPADRLSVQVLDDSTDADTRALVDEVCAAVRASTGVDCHVRHRADRQGYKAGALEDGRRETDAEFLAIFDADFVPPEDFLLRTIPHFYRPDGEPDDGLALVQAQWGHLNHDESPLTRAQSLWVDDHHTLQMSWRSAMWQFVNFTGTAGRLARLGDRGRRRLARGEPRRGLRAELPAPVRRLPDEVRQGDRRARRAAGDLHRLQGAAEALDAGLGAAAAAAPAHAAVPIPLLAAPPAPSRLPHVHLVAVAGVGDLDHDAAAPDLHRPLVRLARHRRRRRSSTCCPPLLWAVVAATMASLETKHTYAGTPHAGGRSARRVGRVVPYLVINTGMLPHQFSSFAEGLFGRMHSEFERTPKAASVTRRIAPRCPAQR